MHEKPDAQLLRDYADGGDEAAFGALVARYTDLVYSSALRQVESPDAAADIVQGVFLDLARKADSVGAQLEAHASLAGWLHRGTRYAALNHLRANRRRITNERQAMEQLVTDSEPSPDWEVIRPVLDEALDSLEDADREAVLMRYFQQRDFRTVGEALGVNDDAAQKRVCRALERLRGFFSQRKVTVGATTLGVLLSAHAVQAAPAGLAAVTAAAVAGTALETAAVTAAATKVIGMSVLQKLAVTGSIVALAGIGVYEAREASQLRAQVRVLETQLAAMEPPDRQSPGQALPPLAVGAFVPGDQSVGDRAAANLNFPGTTQPSPSALAGLTPQSFAAQARQTAAQMQEEQRRFLAAHGSGVGGSGMGATGLPEAGALGPATLSTKSVNGSTVIVYRGREFPVGRTQGMVSTRAASIQGTDYAAAFDDKRVIWESVPGAAERLK